jgi:hypothetical protein
MYIQLKIEVAYLRDVLEKNITEILRMIEEQGIDLTRLTIEHGKTAETVSELEVAKEGSQIVPLTYVF